MTSLVQIVSPNPVPPYFRAIEPSECLKDLILLFLWDADARVLYHEMKAGDGVFVGLLLHSDEDLPLFGELNRVANQVDENLANPSGISNQGFGNFGLNIVDQFQSLLMRPNAKRLHRLAKALAEIKGNCFNLKLSCFNL